MINWVILLFLPLFQIKKLKELQIVMLIHFLKHIIIMVKNSLKYEILGDISNGMDNMGNLLLYGHLS